MKKVSLITAILITTILLFLCSQAEAANFHLKGLDGVNADGEDGTGGHDGTTHAKGWLTWEYAITQMNGKTAGDDLYVNCGETFAVSSGSSNVWTLDGASVANPSIIAAYYDDGTTHLNVVLGNSPIILGATAESTYPLRINGALYVTIENLDIRGGFMSLWIRNGSHNFTVKNTFIGQNCHSFGVALHDSDNGLMEYCTIDSGFETGQENTKANIDGVSFYRGDNFTFQYNKMTSGWEHANILCHYMTNSIIRYNYVDGNGGVWSDDYDGQPFGSYRITGNEIYGNWFENYQTQFQISSGCLNNLIYNNILDTSTGETYTNDSLMSVHNMYDYDISGNDIYNNTFYNSVDRNGIQMHTYATEYDCTNNRLTNNIVHTWYRYGLDIEDSSDTHTNTFSNNVFYDASDIEVRYRGTTYTVAATWEAAASNGDTLSGNSFADPGLANPGSEQFWPDDPDDPVVDAGSTVLYSSWGIKNGETKAEWTDGTGVGATFALQTISRSGENQEPDIGAYEYEQTGAPEPPTGGEEDFSDVAGPVPTWTLVDPAEPDDITRDSATKVSWSGLDIRNTSSHYYCDYGADYFNSNWDFQFEVYASSVTDGVAMIHWQLGDEVDDLKTMMTENGGEETDDAVVLFLKNDGGQYKLWLELVEDGGWVGISDVVNISASTLYYITVNRNHSGGANSTGQYTLTARTGSHEGVLVGNVSDVDCSAGEQNGFQYLYVCNTYNSATAAKVASGYTQNLVITDRSSTIAFTDVVLITTPDGTPGIIENPTATWSDSTVQFIGLELNKILTQTANPTVARVKLLTGITATDFTWIYFYRILSIDDSGTLRHFIVFKYTPVVGDRSTDLSFDAVSDALDCNSATLISDGDDLCDEANDDLSREDIGGTGEITLAFSSTSTSPITIGSGKDADKISDLVSQVNADVYQYLVPVTDNVEITADSVLITGIGRTQVNTGNWTFSGNNCHLRCVRVTGTVTGAGSNGNTYHPICSRGSSRMGMNVR